MMDDAEREARPRFETIDFDFLMCVVQALQTPLHHLPLDKVIRKMICVDNHNLELNIGDRRYVIHISPRDGLDPVTEPFRT